MAGARIKEVMSSELSSLLGGQRPVLVDFSATWCGPCKAMLPVVERLAWRFAGRAEIVKVDIDRNSDLAAAHGIRSVPTFLLFVGGRAVERLIGMTDERALATLLELHIETARNESATPAAS